MQYSTQNALLPRVNYRTLVPLSRRARSGFARGTECYLTGVPFGTTVFKLNKTGLLSSSSGVRLVSAIIIIP